MQHDFLQEKSRSNINIAYQRLSFKQYPDTATGIVHTQSCIAVRHHHSNCAHLVSYSSHSNCAHFVSYSSHRNCGHFVSYSRHRNCAHLVLYNSQTSPQSLCCTYGITGCSHKLRKKCNERSRLKGLPRTSKRTVNNVCLSNSSKVLVLRQDHPSEQVLLYKCTQCLVPIQQPGSYTLYAGQCHQASTNNTVRVQNIIHNDNRGQNKFDTL